ncbi:phytoene desaturase [Rossellomorea vietnamensis]|uniref:4,4'-diaponeurosporene oxygenase n=2 Tax=Rossellomorea TaxID=2837508 RepID=A0A5D4KH00_9BACI|nr:MULTISPECIES: phytoene desaturase family protein [Rossellomorea]TYR76140.1 phytoene desaturase [Rossellomorea vietnamensis]TYS75547.1 phytoene desaturase [Rossellomorea aquimaris]
MKKIVIIGGGLGGLAAAATLASSGCSVVLFEKNKHLGGKLKPETLGSHRFDFGPNTITMPHVFDSVFFEAGDDPRHYYDWVKLEDHTANWSAEGERFLMSTSKEKVMQQLQTLDPYAYQRYESYLSEIEKLYQLSEKAFFYRTFSSWKDYLSPSLFSAFTKVKPLETMDRFHRRFFKDPFLLQVFNRYATYIGSSPFTSPATFSMIGYLEMVQGVFYVKGGTVKLAESLAKLAEKHGAEIHRETEVTEILTKNKRAVGVRTGSGEKVAADDVILNGDLLQALPKLLKKEERRVMTDKKIGKTSPSISAFVIMAALDHHHDSLIHHQAYFSKDYGREFSELFQGRWPDDPTIYISNSSYTDRDASPEGSNLFILVNAPPLGMNGEMNLDVDKYKELIYKKLEKHGVVIKPYLQQEKIVTPADIQKRFGAYRGALYGVASNTKKDTFLRPFNRSQDIENLYFAGGTTHPGGGSPMVVISGKNVAKKILEGKMS